MVHHQKTKQTRRPLALFVLVLAVGPIEIFPSMIAVAGSVCPAALTPSDVAGPFYVAGSPTTDRLAPETELKNTSQVLLVTGTVYGNDCLLMGVDNDDSAPSITTLEIWYAGLPDANGDVYSDPSRTQSWNYRGQVETDACGNFGWIQTYPTLYPTRPIRHIHLRLSRSNETAQQNQVLLITQIYFDDDNPGSSTRYLQSVPVLSAPDGTRSIHFDIRLDITGVLTVNDCSMMDDTTTSAPSNNYNWLSDMPSEQISGKTSHVPSNMPSHHPMADNMGAGSDALTVLDKSIAASSFRWSWQAALPWISLQFLGMLAKRAL